MTTVDRSRAGLRVKRARGHRVVLHVVESWGAGVRAATLQFVNSTPEVEHHLLRGITRTEFSDEGESVFASVGGLPRGAVGARRAIRRAVRNVQPDVVHAHSSNAGVFVRTAIRSTASRRIVYSPHCFAFERRDLSPFRRRLVLGIEKVLARNTDTLAACSPGEARTAESMAARRVVTVPNTARIPALAMLERRHHLRVVGMGRIGAQKDPDFFRAAVAELQILNPLVTARWIGDGDDHGARHRLEMAGIHTTGWLPSFDTHRTLGASGVYLHTARWEGFPLSILEAIELGIPVIARDVPTLNGAIATPGITTPVQMADAADRLVEGGEEARQANLDAWSELLAENTADQQGKALRSIYQ
ncbi:glycosyltransferase [soil metagenome]